MSTQITNPQLWTVGEVSTWLKQLDLSDEEVQMFVDNEISGENLLQMNHSLLREVGLTTVGKRMNLMAAISNITPGNAQITLRDVQNKANEVFVQFDTASLTYLTPKEDNVFKVNIPLRRGVLDFFSSSYIYADGNRESPGVRLQARIKERDAQATVLIGVSGAGKTRTLLDYGNTIWSIYFDCHAHVDFVQLVRWLPAYHGQTLEDHADFEQKAARGVKAFFLARKLVLLRLLKNDGSSEEKEVTKPADWLSFQRSTKTRVAFAEVLDLALHLSDSEIKSALTNVDATLRKYGVDEMHILVDESQELLNILPGTFHSRKREYDDNNRPRNPRAFYSFFVRVVVQELGYISLWAGTHLRLRDISLFASAAGGKVEDEILVFTDFDFLKADDLSRLIDTYLDVAESERWLLLRSQIENIFQGRPRPFFLFLNWIHRTEGKDSLDRINTAMHEYISDFTAARTFSSVQQSYFEFWNDAYNMDTTVRDFSGKSRSYFVRDELIRMVVSTLFSSEQGTVKVAEQQADLLSTALVMLDSQGKNYYLAEPLVLKAALNYLTTIEPDALADYFADMLFGVRQAVSPTPSEKGNIMELYITLRFRQSWWHDVEDLDIFGPFAPKIKNLPAPLIVEDVRSGDPRKGILDPFYHVLSNPTYPGFVLPKVAAGPDGAYSFFRIYVKTSWTPQPGNAKKILVTTSAANDNIALAKTDEWYKPKRDSATRTTRWKKGKTTHVTEAEIYDVMQTAVKLHLKTEGFCHLFIELPDSTFKAASETVDKNSRYIRITKGSPLLVPLLTEHFVERMNEWVDNYTE